MATTIDEKADPVNGHHTNGGAEVTNGNGAFHEQNGHNGLNGNDLETDPEQQKREELTTFATNGMADPDAGLSDEERAAIVRLRPIESIDWN
jgi:hypothetical protein